MRMKVILTAGLGLAMAAAPVFAQASPTASAAPATDTNATPGLNNQKERLSYAIGMNIATSLKRGNYDVDTDILFSAINDVMAGRSLKLTEAQERDAFNVHSKEAREKQMEENRKMSEKNRKAGDEFLAENKTKPGVKTEMITLQDGTKAEMQYKVITEGTGEMPKTNDNVTVSFQARLIDGKEFENSTSRPQAGKMQIAREKMMVRGLGEALGRMKTGSKWEIYLPSSLAFGDRGYRAMGQTTVEPGSTVIYDIQLESIDAPPAPLTSDIIRVPSAEEMKAGKKVEVLKPEDVARMQAQATNGAAVPK